jgi:hypothetical protein
VPSQTDAVQVEFVGAWLSLVERPVRDRKVAGSNPVAPITFPWVHSGHIGNRLFRGNKLLPGNQEHNCTPIEFVDNFGE